MPYEQRTKQVNVAANHDSLVGAMVNEFTNPIQTAMPSGLPGMIYDAPHIIEGKLRDSDRLEVYVVWDRWRGVREDHGTAAILDAYKQAPEPDKAQRIVIAIGVTPDEARELGVIR